jgi:5-methylcytosine-specific restriction enzyme subunit McrC
MTVPPDQDIIRCHEFEELNLRISAEIADQDVLFIQREFGTKIKIRVELRDGHRICVLNPNQYVGVLSLPSGCKLEIHSKVRAQNILYMLSFADGLPWPFLDEHEHFERLDELLEILAELFAARVADLMEAGLYRAYAEEEENLRFVRGRIQFADDLRLNALNRHRTFCAFSELTWDTDENQILRSTLNYLSGLGFAHDLRLEIAALENQMEEVSLKSGRPFSNYRLHYHRMNEHYRPLHAMCRLFLEGASISEEHGNWISSCFLVDMNDLFERYVSTLLRSQCPSHLDLMIQRRVPFIHPANISVQPDLLVANRDVILLPLDCKYKRGGESIAEADLYQLLAYCIVTQSPYGVLIFPEEPRFSDSELPVIHSEVRLLMKGLRLEAPLAEFIELGKELAGSVFRIAERIAQGELQTVA